MAYSLLAHLYPHIKGSQEDVATLSLQYLLTQSSALNKVFTKRVVDILNVEVEEILQYATQVTGEENERPDMAGTDSNGKEKILCEMKFYAGLTANQPLGYLDRLKKNNGKGLLFICPKSRIDILWFELKKLCIDNKKSVEEINYFCVKVDGINMAVITWSEIIETLMNTAQASAEHLIADIKQLKGYCDLIDKEAFIPFKPEELTAINAQKAERFYTVLDKVTDLLLYDENLVSNKKGLKATANRYGYISYLIVNDYALSICYDRDFWGSADTIDTPFWLIVKDKEWNQNEEIKRQLNKYNEKAEYKSIIYLPLKVLTYVAEDDVCKTIKNQILKYIEDVERGIDGEKKVENDK